MLAMCLVCSLLSFSSSSSPYLLEDGGGGTVSGVGGGGVEGGEVESEKGTEKIDLDWVKERVSFLGKLGLRSGSKNKGGKQS